MRETPEDLRRLQELLERSIGRAGEFLRSSFRMPEHSLSAEQLANHLRGIRNVALATVTQRGEPRVAPTGALFYRGAFHIPTVAAAARARHVARRPAVSLTYYEGSALAIIAHGRAALIPAGEPEFEALNELYISSGGQDIRAWGEAVYLRIDPDVLYTFALYPDRFPG
ncbi:pyridoxamine 5'-phosphate oxidase family protein [Rubrobacter taiwanensis]|uniref:Pyridoxamine 5'-phosphate oxidase family protein n=1 Tax=Rubrobacter taiwanensis TaxID=185139 RepID=A0A4V2NXA5_9ACTN|nr:pyridoxamine 5'-phosphate oxidase family protein [Rubrobacter taiwanensis]TCJ20532.1 pyridoxamine 5'-phosphate oxidase family protein [Rubrobacter taiwanensis]